MKERDLFDAIGGVGSDLIEESAAPFRRATRAVPWKPLLAALLALVILAVPVGGYAISVEAAEYREALAFFQEHALSAEGLSRYEIKAVWRDITTRSFSYEKTAEVLNTLAIEMYATELGTLDREDLKAFWFNRYRYDEYGKEEPIPTGLWYRLEYLDYSQHPASYDIQCFEGTRLLWTRRVEESAILHMLPVGDRVLIYGFLWSSTNRPYAILLDRLGGVCWEYTFEAIDGEIETAYFDRDRVVLIGRDLERTEEGLRTTTLFYAIGQEGTLLIERRIPEQEPVSYGTYSDSPNMVRVGDLYLVRGGSTLHYFTLDGEKTEKKSYSDENGQYIIREMFYADGRVWLSAYQEIPQGEARDAWADEVKKEYQRRWMAHESFPPLFFAEEAEYTAYWQDVYKATLFVCDESGEIKKAYEAAGAYASHGSLSTDEYGNIVWSVQRIDRVRPPSPFLSVGALEIMSTEVQMILDGEGHLLDKVAVKSH